MRCWKKVAGTQKLRLGDVQATVKPDNLVVFMP